MHEIQSRQNPFFKKLQRIARAAGSAREPYILLEGIHLCAAWSTQFDPPKAVVINKKQVNQKAIITILKTVANTKIYVLSNHLFNILSDVINPQGIMFLVKKPEYNVPAAVKENCLLLDRIQDPGNLGTILRTAASLNINHIYLTQGTVSPWSPKVLRSAQGAHFHLAIYESTLVKQWVKQLAIPLAITVLEGGQSLYESQLKGPIAWAFGNESQGINTKWLPMATHLITIEHATQVESLNVAVAAAVCLFEHQRQNHSLVKC